MPTYVYRREDGTTFETRQSITDEPLDTCPETGQSVERLISGGGGVLTDGSSSPGSSDATPDTDAPACPGGMCGL
jgi:putative FmdB family regulatory protein